jgi:hypothetical protein
MLSLVNVIGLKIVPDESVIPARLLNTRQLWFEPQKVSAQLTDDPDALKTRADVTPDWIDNWLPLTLTASKLAPRPDDVLPASSHWKVEPVL